MSPTPHSSRKSRRPRAASNSQPAEISLVRQWAIALAQRLALFSSVGALILAGGLLALAVLVAIGVLPPPFIANGAVGFEFPPTPTPEPTATRTPLPPPDIAIIAGHWSHEDPLGVTTVHDTGALCDDGLREVTINKSVADKVVTVLRNRGFRVDLLEEFDVRLKSVSPDYAPDVLLSIHSDSCVSGPDYPLATGFKIAHAEPSEDPAGDDRLVACLRRDYQIAVNPFKLTFNENTITSDMTAYHAFREIVPTRPAAIIELGFMGNDRNILIEHQDELARALALGLTAFLKGDPCGAPAEAPTPTPTPAP
jgi:hypothetical protein